MAVLASILHQQGLEVLAGSGLAPRVSLSDLGLSSLGVGLS